MKTRTIFLALTSLAAVGGLFGAEAVALASTNVAVAVRAQGTLPPYLVEDFNSACEKAKQEGRLVLVSLGREICGRCQKFYGFVRDGQVKIDPSKYVFIRLDVDNYEHREYFYSTFDPPDRKLPFVGVMDGDRTARKEALSGSHTPAEYQKLMSEE
ncbi:MAG: thioredoxin family protein [Kiritimatiellae bacterium]|nr:thioredoxin family protein [Kiritimatiellia bacterium]